MARLSLTALAAAGVLLLFAHCTEGAPAQSKPELHRRNNITRPSGGVFGVDVSSPYSQDTFACLLDNGYTVAIVRAYQSTGMLYIAECCTCCTPIVTYINVVADRQS